MADVPAGLELASVFGDGMVLQRDQPIVVWGEDLPGHVVRVSIGDASATGEADAEGRWRVTLPTMAAGGPVVMRVTGTGEREVTGVLVGDVWLCAGQSNMHMSLAGVEGGDRAIDEARRFSQVRVNGPSGSGGWSVPNAEAARKFSAVAWWFGCRLHEELDVPIGLVVRAEGGVRAQAFISRWALTHEPVLKRKLLDPWEGWDASLPRRRAELAEAPAGLRGVELKPLGEKQAPARYFDEAIEPVIPLGLRGVVWYQGESDAPAYDMAELYEAQLSTLIRDWRSRWGQPELPFVVVQLPELPAPKPLDRSMHWPREYAPWHLVQEAQAKVAQTLEHVGLAVAIDTGVEDIHPRSKQPVAERAALAALGVAYERDVAFRGPTLADVRRDGDALRLRFDHAHGGLVAEGGQLTGFAIAGRDRLFRWAQASIEGDEVVLRNDQTPEPMAARYVFSEQAKWSLRNGAGLLAGPFRTDVWPWDLQAPPREARAARVASDGGAAPVIDGKLDDAIWQDAAVIGDFMRVHSWHVEGDVRARAAWDAEHLYIAFECDADAPPRAACRTADDDAIWLDDHVALLIDSEGAGLRYHLVMTNAVGTLYDLAGYCRVHDDDPLVPGVLDHQRHVEPTWQSQAKVATATNDGGWSVELAVPWSSLGHTPRAGQRLGIQFERITGEVRRQWQITGRTKSTAKLLPAHYVGGLVRWHAPSRFGTLVLGE